MKKLAFAAAALAFAVAQGFAQDAPTKVTIDFETPEGILSVTLDSSTGKFTASNGDSGTYSYDEATKKLCSTSGENPSCVTFAETKQEVGFSTTFTTPDGGTGKATVTKIE